MPSRRATMIVLFLSFFAFTNISLSENSANKFLQKSTFVRRADASLPMKSMLFAFHLQNEQELKQLLEDQQNPNSPLYHQWITPEEFGKRFGVSEEKYQRVVNWLQQNGFSIAHQYPNRLSIYFDGTAAQVESAFQVRMGIYEQGGKQYYSNDRVAQVPTEFQDATLDVLNLDNFPKEEPLFKSGSTISMGPSDMAIAYNLNPLFGGGINGAGQSVAIVARSDFNLSDVRTFRSIFGLAVNDPQKVFVGSNPGNLGGSEEGEVLLDTEWSGAMAPNATIKVVIPPNKDIGTSMDYIVNSLSSAHVMSISFGAGESQFSTAQDPRLLHIYNAFSQAAMQGQTVFVSSGDQGAQQFIGKNPDGSSKFSDGLDINYLCASPYVVCVGGTNLNPLFDSSGNATGYGGETAWGGIPGKINGSGGGRSSFISKPSFQVGPGVPNDGARDVPDVAAQANLPGVFLYQGGTITCCTGGTSLSAPLWAGFFALVNQAVGGNGVGWANPRIYELARNQFSGGPAVFHDVTSGNNSTPTVPGFTAGVGYDQVTGWGSFNGDLFVRNFASSSSGGTVPIVSGVQTNGSIQPNTSSTSCLLSPSQYTIDVPSGALQLIVSLTGNPRALLYVRQGQPVLLSTSNIITTDFGSQTTLSNQTIYVGPQSTPVLSSGTYYIGVVNCLNSPANFTLTATVITPSSTAKIEEMAIDDGTVETGLLGDGLVAVNRLTPPRYPSRLTGIRIFVTNFQNQPDPVNKQIRLIAFSDPSGSGRPPSSPVRMVDQFVTINGESGFIDFNISNGPTINSGDWYIGFQYPNPGNGVLAAGDTSGVQQQRSFFSNDNGTTFIGPLTLGGKLTNLMIRGVVENDNSGNPNVPIIDSFSASFLPDGTINLTVVGRHPLGTVKSLTETRFDSNGLVLGGGTFDISSRLNGQTSFSFTLQIGSGNQLANTSQVQVKLTDTNGNDSNTKTASLLSSSFSLTVPSSGASNASTSGTNATVKAGYATVTVNSGNPPYGTAVFSLTQNGVVVSEAGVPASPPTTAARILVDYRTGVAAKSDHSNIGTININTGFAMANRGTGTANITYLLRNFMGTPLTTGHGSLAQNVHKSLFITELNQIAPDFFLPSNFPTAIGFATLEITSNQPLSFVALRLTNNQRGDTLLTSTPIADLSKTLGTGQLFLAQFVDGGGFKSTVPLLNTSNSVETGTIRIFDDSGSPFPVRQVGDSSSFSVFTYNIQPGGLNTLVTDGSPTATHVGSLQITPDPGTFAPVTAGIFGFSVGGVLVTESGVPTAKPTTHARVYVDLSNNHNSGIALASPNGFPIAATLTAYQLDGTTFVGSGSVNITGNGHSAKFASEFIPSLPSGFVGVLDISASSPFVALTLRSLNNSRGDFLITTFPIADFNQAAPAPIVFPQIADGGGFKTQFIELGTGTGISNTSLNFFDDNGAALGLGKKTDQSKEEGYSISPAGTDSGKLVSLNGKR